MAFPEVDEHGRCIRCSRLRQVGDFPQCPHERVSGDPYKAQYFQDEIPGGMVLEHGFKEPVTVYSWSEMNALYAKNDLVVQEKFCPTPGTDRDPAGVQDFRKYRDPKTLANGAALILRQAKAESDDFDPDKVFRVNDEGGPTDLSDMGYVLCEECHGEKRFPLLKAKDMARYLECQVYRYNGEFVVDCLGCGGSGLQEVKHASDSERENAVDPGRGAAD